MANGITAELDVFGGTLSEENISTDPNFDDNRPKHGKVQELLDNQVDRRVKDLYRSIEVIEQVPFDDSLNFNCDSHERIVATIRDRAHRLKRNFIIILGSDQGAYAAHAIAEGIDPDKLGESSVVVVVTMEASPKMRHKSDVIRSQAGADLTNAIYHSARAELRGKITFYCSGMLFAPRGLRKLGTPDPMQPFVSRYDPVTRGRNPPVYEWEHFFVREPVRGTLDSSRNVLLPTGAGARYKLMPGVEALPMDSISNYENVLACAEGGLRRGSLRGLIVPAPSGRFRNISDDIEHLVKAAEICVHAGVPFLTITADPHERQRQGVSRSIPSKPFVYGSSATLDHAALIAGCPINLTEAKMTMSESLHYGVKKERLMGSDVAAYVNDDIEAYTRFVQNQVTIEEYMEWKRARRKM